MILNNVADKVVETNKKQETVADKKLNSVANKAVNSDKKQDAVANK